MPVRSVAVAAHSSWVPALPRVGTAGGVTMMTDHKSRFSDGPRDVLSDLERALKVEHEVVSFSENRPQIRLKLAE